MCKGGKYKHVGVRHLQKGDIIGCFLDLTKPEIQFSLNGNLMDGVFKEFNIDGLFFPTMSLSSKVSCRFVLGGIHGQLKYGPPKQFSAIADAAQEKVTIGPCFSFGDMNKAIFAGPSTNYTDANVFVPAPIDTSQVSRECFSMSRIVRQCL